MRIASRAVSAETARELVERTRRTICGRPRALGSCGARRWSQAEHVAQRPARRAQPAAPATDARFAPGPRHSPLDIDRHPRSLSLARPRPPRHQDCAPAARPPSLRDRSRPGRDRRVGLASARHHGRAGHIVAGRSTGHGDRAGADGLSRQRRCGGAARGGDLRQSRARAHPARGRGSGHDGAGGGGRAGPGRDSRPGPERHRASRSRPRDSRSSAPSPAPTRCCSPPRRPTSPTRSARSPSSPRTGDPGRGAARRGAPAWWPVAAATRPAPSRPSRHRPPERPRAQSPVPLEPARCPAELPDCRTASGRIIYVERVDPDGDGDAHFVLASRDSITGPGISTHRGRALPAPAPPPRAGRPPQRRRPGLSRQLRPEADRGGRAARGPPPLACAAYGR